MRVNVQTFLPYADFELTARTLDARRLGKQRVEAYQILRALTIPGYGWQRHPAVLMWRGYEDALRQYMNACIREWVRRGYRNNMALAPVPAEVMRPPWLGDERLHAGYRSNLLRKDPSYYAQFGWVEPPDLPYFWPIPAEPADAADMPDALDASDHSVGSQRKRAQRRQSPLP